VELIVAIFLVVNAIALLLLPRRWAPLPLLAGACFMTRGQTLQLGFAAFTVVRILIAVGVLRLVIRREWILGRLNSLDGIMIGWGVWMVAAVVFHAEPDSPFVLRMRDLYEAWGLYLLFRVFCRSREDIPQVARILALVLLPVAAAMVVEKITGANLFARFGGVPEFSTVRNGVIRAQGPFAHSILAGSIGGVCLPLMIGLWHDRRMLSLIGIGACAAMVLASGSSGPILAVGAGLGVLLMWPLRQRMRLVRWGLAFGYIGLELIMSRPAFFIISDIDLMGGSTAWFRAQLIQSTIDHANEWWLVGTDYTRHWMPSGVISSPNQTDITNHFIAMGVVGGLLLMVLFIAMIFRGFWLVGTGMASETTDDKKFDCWTVGASLFAHAVTCLSVSYYDHSIIFLYLTLAATTATMWADPAVAIAPVHELASAAVQAPAQSEGGLRSRARAALVRKNPPSHASGLPSQVLR
jgi:hypothetical protein